MIKKEKKKQNVEKIKDILCNLCGKSCKKPEGFFEYATFNAHWGYFSDSRDGEVHEAHLCQKCWEKVSKYFVIPDLVATEQY